MGYHFTNPWTISELSDVSLDPRNQHQDPLGNVGDGEEEEDDMDEYEEEEQQPLLFEASAPVRKKKSPPTALLKNKVAPEPVLPENTRLIIEAITQQQQATFNQMMEHSKRENEQLKTLLREERDHQAKRAASETSSSNPKKAKTITEPSLADETWWTIGTFDVRDNQTDQLCLDLRARLGSINADPKVIIDYFG